MNMQILKFTTTITREKDALNISNLLKNYFGLKSASINLETSEKFLLVEGKHVVPNKIEQTLIFLGFQCRLLN